ncbi:MAG: enoyl-CoA hydratase/isomerase family protein [Aestuariivirga sp.]|nr:enoyl-CoA hydratase/isomerase family protein [Aestuariivirga sp.]
MTSGLIRRDVSGAVLTLTLARADKLNAFTSAMLRELRGAISEAGETPALRVLVLTGEGRAFSTGQDLSALDGDDVNAILARDYEPLVLALMDSPLVTIAAVNGTALGAGANIALSCDIAVAAERATIVQAFVRIGLIPDAGGTWLLPRLVGLRNAMALALTGDSLTAREAQGMGLFYRVFPDDRFEAEVMAMAQAIAGRSPTACRLIKQSLRASLGNDLPTQLTLEAELQGRAAETDEFRDAVKAFLARKAS